MNIEIITKVADLIIKGGILTTLAYGIKKFASTPKAQTESETTAVPSEEKSEEAN